MHRRKHKNKSDNQKGDYSNFFLPYVLVTIMINITSIIVKPTIRSPHKDKLPLALIKKLIKARIKKTKKLIISPDVFYQAEIRTRSVLCNTFKLLLPCEAIKICILSSTKHTTVIEDFYKVILLWGSVSG